MTRRLVLPVPASMGPDEARRIADELGKRLGMEVVVVGGSQITAAVVVDDDAAPPRRTRRWSWTTR